MAFPKDFRFANEEAFRDDFVIPLLRRLGYSLVKNYHGQREFGKDIVFGEIDRFGEVMYHGMQVKYVPSISQNEIQDVINDAHQAFNNPFQHPQSGGKELICMFFAATGGTFGDGAKEHFFNTLLKTYGPRVRLLDGKELLLLDRNASMQRVQMVGERLQGITAEIQKNRENIPGLVDMLQKYVDESGPFPIFRLRVAAVTAYMEFPFLPNEIPYDLVHAYWQRVNAINEITVSMGVPISVGEFKKQRLEGLRQITADVLQNSMEIDNAITAAVGKLGPLAMI